MHGCSDSTLTTVSDANPDVKILSEAFGGLHQWSQAVRRLKVVMVLPRCSCSALSDPVGVIHAEHGGKSGV